MRPRPQRHRPVSPATLRPCAARAGGLTCLSLLCSAAFAQTPAPEPVFVFKPSFDLALNYIDTKLLGDDQNQGGADFVTQVRPGFYLKSRSGRVRGSANYLLEGVHHSHVVPALTTTLTPGQTQLPNTGQGDSIYNRLNSAFVVEAIEKWAFVDIQANINQRSRTVYDQQSVSTSQVNGARTEVADLTLKPYVRGMLSDVAVYDASLNYTAVRNRGYSANDATGTGGTVSLGSPSTGAKLGWSASFNQQRADYKAGRTTDSNRLTLSLVARPDIDLRTSARVGEETTDVGGLVRQRYTNWGGDVTWTPTPRTLASLTTDKRYFGQSYQLTLDHRFPLTTVHFTSSRDALGVGGNGTSTAPVTLFQVYYSLFATIFPDPAVREQKVREFLTTQGADPNQLVGGGFITNGASLLRRNDLSLAFGGRRTIVTLQVFNTDSRLLDTIRPTLNSLPVRQVGGSANVSYRLTPTANLLFATSRLKTKASESQGGNDLKSASLSWSDQWSHSLSTSVSARRSVFDGPINPYRESALSATLSLRY